MKISTFALSTDTPCTFPKPASCGFAFIFLTNTLFVCSAFVIFFIELVPAFTIAFRLLGEVPGGDRVTTLKSITICIDCPAACKFLTVDLPTKYEARRPRCFKDPAADHESFFFLLRECRQLHL